MNVTDSMAGGDTTADGTGSSLGGNVVNAPIGGAAGVFGSAASVIGFADGGSVNDVVSGSGGNVDTSGAGGSLAGNVLSAQALPVAEVFGTAATVGGLATRAGENTTDVVSVLQAALQTQHLSNVDLDFVLPPGAVVPLQPDDLEDVPDDEDGILDPTLRQYGGYTPLVKLFGEPVFLPTSRLRRAPSKPTALNRSKSFTKDQKLELRMKLGELVDTEERYVLKLNELVKHIADDFRQHARKRPKESLSPTDKDIEKL